MEKASRPLSRRGLFVGAGGVGAAAAATALLPSLRPEPAPQAEPVREPPARGGGYHLSEHVRRYYKSTRI